MVLLKNQDELLPLPRDSRIALFGKGSFDYVKGGGGSGDVTCAYVRNLYDGLKGEGVSLWEPLSDYYQAYVEDRYAAGDIPGLMAEPELPETLLDSARENADIAVIVLSRFSGEGWDRIPVIPENKDYVWADEVLMPQRAQKIFPEGDYYLTDAERAMVERVCAVFERQDFFCAPGLSGRYGGRKRYSRPSHRQSQPLRQADGYLCPGLDGLPFHRAFPRLTGLCGIHRGCLCGLPVF